MVGLAGSDSLVAVFVRNVIVHYHIFKNAGTSIDTCLDRSFSLHWDKYDVDEDWANISSIALYEQLLRYPHLRAISSHQARWPEPSFDDLQAHPIVFVRHPIDRVGSMYAFAVRREEGFVEGASFARYVDKLLAPETGFVVRSAQTLLLSDDDHLIKPPGPATTVTPAHFGQAIGRLQDLAAFGLVEHFGSSLALIGRHLRPLFPELRLEECRENASAGRAAALEDRLWAIRRELGRRRYASLLDANAADIELWNRANELFQTKWTRVASLVP